MFLESSHFARRLLAWYDQHRRELPWRAARDGKPNPYHVLLSELMLQQTQVATVVPYFNRFIKRLPTLADLAAADEQAVLRLWQGLGYYSRARNLRAAAQRIMAEHGGKVPSTAEELLRLPGVGRYTAGAVASIAFDTKVPILDGNVARVLCRIDRIQSDPRGKQTQAILWRRATEILPPRRAGDFNSAMMELGATICTPRSPGCLQCPVREHCESFAAGVQDRIPPPRKAKPTPLVHRRTFCLRHGADGQAIFLIEQRPPRGRWASLWQFVTVGCNGPRVTSATARAAAAEDAVTSSASPRLIGTVEHALTHRRYRFEVYLCDVRKPKSAARSSSNPVRPRRWVRLADLEHFPLPRPHLRIAQMLQELAHSQ